MAAVVVTAAKQTPNPDFVAGNKKFRFRTLTTDTGDYTTDGIAIPASYFGLKRFAALIPQGALRDAAGADEFDLATPISVRYSSDRQTAYLILYDSAGDGDALDQKPAEAMTVSTVSALAIGH